MNEQIHASYMMRQVRRACHPEAHSRRDMEDHVGRSRSFTSVHALNLMRLKGALGSVVGSFLQLYKSCCVWGYRYHLSLPSVATAQPRQLRL